jgi:ubiquinol-cytochrome c reductase cytochrome b subunit
MKALLQWLEERTGVGAAATTCSEQAMPGRACACKIWPATILLAFCVQAITGFFLWLFYSPSVQSAWESVWFIQDQLCGGWLLRAMHHYSAHVLLALLLIYVVQTILTAAYRAPRELVFWTAVGMGLCALAAILTGDLLAWNQNGYASTKTRTGFLTLLPVVGDSLLKIAIGGPGPALGNHTLTRFFGLHVAAFGGGFAALLVLHYIVLRKAEAVQVAKAGRAGAPLWGCQARYNAAACLIVLAVILALSCQHGVSGPERGVFLGSPADTDPANSYAAARPEWFLTGVFEFSHWFPGPTAVLAIFVIPGALVCLVLAMPFIARRPAGQAFNVLFTLFVLVGLAILTKISWSKDAADEKHQAAIATEKEKSARTRELAAHQGIPAAGALALLQSDPKTEGPRLYEKSCACCHHYTTDKATCFTETVPSAPDLGGFASRQWIAGLLDPKQISGPKYFGNTAFRAGKMSGFVKETFADLDEEQKEEIKKIAAAVSAEAGLISQAEMDQKDKAAIEEGRALMVDTYSCTTCHTFRGKGAKTAPLLTGYGSREWLVGMIADPSHPALYGKQNDRMPVYLKSLERPGDNALSPAAVGTVADWLRGEWFEPDREPAADGETPARPLPAEVLFDRWQMRKTK